MTMAKKLTVLEGEGLDAWRRKLAELLDGDSWTLADALVEMYPEDDYPEDDSSGRTGLYHVLLADAEALRSDYGVDVTHGRLRNMRATALAWPRASREARTSFKVHSHIRGANRQAEMTKRLRQAEREGFALTASMLSRFRAEEKPKQPGRPYNERVKRAIVAAVKREMLGGLTTKRDDWWMVRGVSQTTRDIAVQELRALASAINRGAIDE